MQPLLLWTWKCLRLAAPRSLLRFLRILKKKAKGAQGQGGTKVKMQVVLSIRLINTNSVYQRIYMEFRKMVMMTLYARQPKRHRYKEQTFGLCGRRRGWDDMRE